MKRRDKWREGGRKDRGCSNRQIDEGKDGGGR